MIRCFTNWLALLTMGVALAGCDQAPIPPAATKTQATMTTSGTMVVLDLNAVAKAMGEDLIFKEQVEKASTSLTQQLNQIAGELNKQLESEKSKLGGDPSAEDKQKLERMASRAQLELRKKQQEARQRRQIFQTQLRQKFLEAVRPVAATIAQERKASAVVFKGSSLIWSADNVDITRDVITQMQANARNNTSSGAANDASSSTSGSPTTSN